MHLHRFCIAFAGHNYIHNIAVSFGDAAPLRVRRLKARAKGGAVRDLLGHPISFPGVSARRRAELLYAEADAAPLGSPERAALYRRAAEAQREADAAARVAQRCAERVALLAEAKDKA